MSALGFCEWTGCRRSAHQRMTLTDVASRTVFIERLICDRHLALEFPLSSGTSLTVTKP